jgi:hypothetical protein
MVNFGHFNTNFDGGFPNSRVRQRPAYKKQAHQRRHARTH